MTNIWGWIEYNLALHSYEILMYSYVVLLLGHDTSTYLGHICFSL
jgi:hypothetical protein